jgi:hypothetical protein
MRSGVEEYKEWRRWRFLSFDQKLDCVSMDVPYFSSDLLPYPSHNTDYWAL